MTTVAEPDLRNIEEFATEHLTEEALHAEIPEEQVEDVDAVALGRLIAATATTVIAAAVMVGGVFQGVSPRMFTIVAGLLGIGLAVVVQRVRSPAAANVLVVLGIAAIGVVMLVGTGPGNVGQITALIQEAKKNGDVLRPPVPFRPGWAPITGWLMAIVGFAAGWVSIAFKKPALGLLVPLPILGIAAISVPKGQQLGSGLAALVLFAVGLGLLSSAQRASEVDQKVSAGYEIRRVLKSLPVILVVTVALYAAAQSNLLFPKPLIDPTNTPQEPKALPLSPTDDRVLFTVTEAGEFVGPFRVGSLDYYEVSSGKFLLPPFAESKLAAVPSNGTVDKDLISKQGISAKFEVNGLAGSVLPGVPNPVAVNSLGPALAYDPRTSTLRVDQGNITPGQQYRMQGVGTPTPNQLSAITEPATKEALAEAIAAPPIPPAAQAWIDDAQQENSLFSKMNKLRLRVLAEVTVAGQGKPVPITVDRINDMLSGSKEGSPFEIVALEVLFARWVGVPARIGYGFDSDSTPGQACSFTDGKLEVRPACSASFPEFFFPGYGWVPINKAPTKQKPSVGSDSTRKNTAQAAENIAVQLYLPIVIAPRSVFAKQLLIIVGILATILLLAALVYALTPLVTKSLRRRRIQEHVDQLGYTARIGWAYAQLRDLATDFGYRHDSDTPLMFVDRVSTDDEHVELAWLVTRVLYGDLRGRVEIEHVVAAEELSRALRRRLSAAHSGTVRAVAAVSRLSQRHPFAPNLEPPARASRKEKKEHDAAQPAPAV